MQQYIKRILALCSLGFSAVMPFLQIAPAKALTENPLDVPAYVLMNAKCEGYIYDSDGRVDLEVKFWTVTSDATLIVMLDAANWRPGWYFAGPASAGGAARGVFDTPRIAQNPGGIPSFTLEDETGWDSTTALYPEAAAIGEMAASGFTWDLDGIGAPQPFDSFVFNTNSGTIQYPNFSHRFDCDNIFASDPGPMDRDDDNGTYAEIFECDNDLIFNPGTGQCGSFV